MARTLPTSVVQAIDAQTTDNVFLVLMDITHPTFTTVRLVNNTEDITSGGNLYSAFPFSIVLPPDSEEFQPRLRVSVINVTNLLIAEVRTIAGNSARASATVKIIEASDPDTVLAQWSNFELVEVNYDQDILSFALVIETFLTEPFPSQSFTPANFPGIF